MEKEFVSRRSLLKGGAGFAGANLMRVAFPSSALAQPDEQVVPWVDQIPAPPASDASDNLQQWERLDTWITPFDRFFNVNHYGQPASAELDEANWLLRIGGRVARPYSLTVADIKGLQRREVDFTLECSGNNGFDWVVSAIGNARWSGTQLAPLLRRAGLLDDAVEVVFYGIDKGPVTIRDNGGILSEGSTGTLTHDADGNVTGLSITEQFARSMSIEEAMEPTKLLCYEMNGDPLPAEHGFPLRLIAPGWFGIANVKWLNRIEVLNRRYAGRLMARDYVSIREQQIDGNTVWTFTTVGPIMLKSAPGRVVARNNRYAIRGAAWGAPIAGVQVQIDGGPWLNAKLEAPPKVAIPEDDFEGGQDASFDRRSSRRGRSTGYAWRFWVIDWGRPVSGEHTVRSRAIDTDGNVQPAPEDPFLASKRTYWESNGQITRTVRIP